MHKSKRSKATDIPYKVKQTVWERDNKRCILCNSPHAMPNAHFLPRGSKGGLGIEQNIVTLCQQCHHKLDNSIEREKILNKVKIYLINKYPSYEDSYECAYKSMITHSNYWLSKMKNKLYYKKGE